MLQNAVNQQMIPANEKKHIGHRQPYTKVEITKIAL